ncbi:MAG: histone deacetylase [Acidobacteriota bacterium]
MHQSFTPTGIVFDKLFLEHDTGLYHPERKERLLSIGEGLQPYPHRSELLRLNTRAASIEELATIHSPAYIERIKRTAGAPTSQLDPDTVAGARSYSVALHAVGGSLVLLEALFNGQIQNGFAFVRPPGHHAEFDRAMGFCLFNNVAIMAAWAIQKYRIERVLVVDFDVHHGNGTQKAFYGRRDVLYVSTHQFPLYPGTGDFDEIGEGQGRGFTVNFPLPAGTEDHTFNLVYERIVSSIAVSYKPELILVSAGYDAYSEDPLAGLEVSDRGFAGLTRTLLQLAEKCCDGRILFVLEGGYHLEGLRRCVLASLDELVGQAHGEFHWKSTPLFERILSQARSTFKTHWQF